MRLTFKPVVSEESRLLSITWVGPIQSAEGLNEKRPASPEEGGIQKRYCLWDLNCDTGSSPGLQPACLAGRFQNLSASIIMKDHSLK